MKCESQFVSLGFLALTTVIVVTGCDDLNEPASQHIEEADQQLSKGLQKVKDSVQGDDILSPLADPPVAEPLKE